MTPDTLLIVPALNEEANIERVILDLQSLDRPVRILIVDDGSYDATSAVARAHGVDVVRHPCNMGYGAALQTGYKFAVRHGYAYAIQFDGDGQHQPQDVSTIWTALHKGQADVVIGSRFLGDDEFSPGVLKSFVIRLFRRGIRALTGVQISDPTSGLRGLKANVFSYYAGFDRLPADYPDADFIVDVCMRRWTIVEVPIANRERDQGRSMHTGLKPMVYFLKVNLSMLVVTINHLLQGRRPRHE